MVFEDNLLGLTVAVSFQKNQYFKKLELPNPFFQSIVYNNVVVTKQIYFLATLFISWVHISYNVAGVVRGPQNY